MAIERIFIDIETSGLSSVDYILELGFAMTDRFGNYIDSRSWRIPPTFRAKNQAVERAKKDPVVGPMHTKSGLWAALEADDRQMNEEEVEAEAIDWISSFELKGDFPMCGSSVHFDRKFIDKHMPTLHDFFSHRNIDNSSTKELCRDLAPEVYSRLAKETKPLKLHRVDPDLQDTVEEYRFYLDNFLRAETS